MDQAEAKNFELKEQIRGLKEMFLDQVKLDNLSKVETSNLTESSLFRVDGQVAEPNHQSCSERGQIVHQTTLQSDDFLARLLKQGLDLKLEQIQWLFNERIPILEQWMGKKINEHLGFNGELEGQGKLCIKYIDEAAEFGWD